MEWVGEGSPTPFSLGPLAPGERVLDLGSGAGTDFSSRPRWSANRGRTQGST